MRVLSGLAAALALSVAALPAFAQAPSAEAVLDTYAERQSSYHHMTAGRVTPGIAVHVQHPVAACLASQYAGWAITPEGYFAMGSGPMRAAAGREGRSAASVCSSRPSSWPESIIARSANFSCVSAASSDTRRPLE